MSETTQTEQTEYVDCSPDYRQLRTWATNGLRGELNRYTHHGNRHTIAPLRAVLPFVMILVNAITTAADREALSGVLADAIADLDTQTAKDDAEQARAEALFADDDDEGLDHPNAPNY